MSAIKIFSNWFVDGCDRLFEAIPANCSLCGQLSFGTSLCTNCIKSLPYPRCACQRCGLELLPGSRGECAACALADPPVQRSLSLLHYQPPIDRLISGFKYHGNFADGKTLARLLAKRVLDNYAATELPQLLIPVPLYLSRWRQRGYNQALELGKTVSRYCELPLAPRLLIRCKNTAPQTTMTSASARQRNLASAFSIIEPNALLGISRIAIIDDVITTMATVNAAAKPLLSVGVKEVHAWSLARATR